MADEERPRTSDEEAEFLQHLEEQIRRMKVTDHIAYMMDSLGALASRKLGLAEETYGERDLEQARLAIEAFRALLQVVEPVRPMQEVNAHRAVLSQLQVAYVKATETPAEEPRSVDTGREASEAGGPAEGSTSGEPEEPGAPTAGGEEECGTSEDEEGIPEDGALSLED
jgi:hypothetical protein